MPKIRISVTIVTISAPIYLIVRQQFTTICNRSADFSLKKFKCARVRTRVISQKTDAFSKA